MEAIVDAEVNEGKNDVESEVGNNCGSDPVVYQLVRVNGCIALLFGSSNLVGDIP